MESINLFKKYKEEKRSNKLDVKAIRDREKSLIRSSNKVANLTKKVSQGKNISKRKKTGEGELFNNIRNSRKHNCDFCNVGIVLPQSYCFAHILNKGVYPEYRLVENNIALVCSIYCHTHLDLALRGNKAELKERIDRGEYLRDYFNELPKKYETTKN